MNIVYDILVDLCKPVSHIGCGGGEGVRLFRVVNNSRNSWIVMLRKILTCTFTETGMQGLASN